MPAQYFSVVTLVGQGRIAAAIAGEGAVAISHLAAGDGNGAPTIPAVNQQGLVHEIWRGAVASVARDPAHPTQVIARATIPGSVGPAIIRELGIYSAAGELVAVANYPATEIAAAGQGALTDVVVDFIFVVDTAAPVTVQVNSNEFVYLQDQRRAPFISIDAFVNAPPAEPAEDALVVAGPLPTGAFAGSPHYFFQWNGVLGLWRQATAHPGTVVHDKATGTYHRRTAEGWEPWEASRTRKGIVRIATTVEVAAGQSEATAVCPKDLHDALGELADTPLANVGAAGVGLVRGLAGDGSAWELRKLAATGGLAAGVAAGGELVLAGPAHANVGGGAGVVKELATLQDGAKQWRHRTLEGTGTVSVTPSEDGDKLVIHGAGRYPGEVVIRQRAVFTIGSFAASGVMAWVPQWTQTITPKAVGSKLACTVTAECQFTYVNGGTGGPTAGGVTLKVESRVGSGAWVERMSRNIVGALAEGTQAVLTGVLAFDVPVAAADGIELRLSSYGPGSANAIGTVNTTRVEILEYQTLPE